MTQLYKELQPIQWPIIYSPEYNIGFLGLEKLHPFDAGKWGRVYQFLKEAGMLDDDTTVRSQEASQDDLMLVHPKAYISSLKWSVTVAGITEVPPVALLPNPIVQRRVLKPFRYQTGGTIMAGKFAMERGWAINIGGGFHHCSSQRGGGFCAYADITLSIRFLFDIMPERVKKAMIVDLDAHQGNGHERDFMNDDRVYILDVYNRNIYPHDAFAKRGIRRKVELNHFTEDDHYLQLVDTHVEGALNEFQPDIIVYNAGTDILDGDPLGCLSISDKGIIQRDQIVFEKARAKKIPVLMVTSGGYQRSTARIIADSILNLRSQQLVSCEAAETALEEAREMAEREAEKQAVAASLPRSTSDSGLFSKFKRWIGNSQANSEAPMRPQGPRSCASSPMEEGHPGGLPGLPREGRLVSPAAEPTPGTKKDLCSPTAVSPSEEVPSRISNTSQTKSEVTTSEAPERQSDPKFISPDSRDLNKFGEADVT